MKLSTAQRRRLRATVDELVASARDTNDSAYRSLVQARFHLKGWAGMAETALSNLGDASYEAKDSELKERIVSLRNALERMLRP